MGSRGRPPSLTPEQKKKLLKFVIKHRGGHKVTASFCKKFLPFLKKACRQVVCAALHEVGYAYLSRRTKRKVPKDMKKPRIDYANWILTLTMATLCRWAYIDGTTFFLARSGCEKEDKGVAALGKYVWRMYDGSDKWHKLAPGISGGFQGSPGVGGLVKEAWSQKVLCVSITCIVLSFSISR